MASYDIVIYGATLSAIFAAKAARSKGDYSVAIIEPWNWRGGLVTGGICLTDFGSAPNSWGYWKGINEQLAEHYGGPGADISYAWRFEPKEMIALIDAFIADDPGITFVYGAPIEKATKTGNVIASITCGGEDYEGAVFLDCSYEGDLMAMAGVACTYGRESVNAFGEPMAGVALTDRVSRSYAMVDANGNRYDNCQPNWSVPDGSADARIQGFNFRMIWSQNPDRLPWQAPPGYRREDFLDVLHEVQSRGLTHMFGQDWWFNQPINGDSSGGSAANKPRPQADGKFGINQRDQYWLASEWATASHARRQELMARLYYRLAGTLYFLANDATLSSSAIQANANAWGLCPDEYQGAGNYYGQPGWSPVVYVREARRMLGQYVLTQHDFGKRGHVSDSVSAAQYFIDRHTISHNANPDGTSYKEGHRDGSGYAFTSIPMRSMKPKPGEADNLLVPVCLSATSVIWQPIRMEPLWSMLGQVCGWIAHAAISGSKTTEAVRYNEISPLLAAEGAII